MWTEQQAQTFDDISSKEDAPDDWIIKIKGVWEWENSWSSKNRV